MPYVDAIYDRKADKIRVVERINGKREYNDLDANHVFYYEHPSGTHRSIFGDSLKKYSSNSSMKFRQELMKVEQSGKKTFEKDINPVFRALADHYMGLNAPNLNIGFFDIEVGFDPDKGYAPTDDPFNEITAITVYTTQNKKLSTYALCPPTLTLEEAEAMLVQFDNTRVYEDECELIEAFLREINDSDVLTGWNCIPKTANVWLDNRIIKLQDIKISDQTDRFGTVKDYHDSGLKRVNWIVLENGMEIEASDEHVIPVSIGDSLASASKEEHRVDALKEKLTGKDEVYVEIHLRENTNKTVDDYLSIIEDNEDGVFDVQALSTLSFKQFVSMFSDLFECNGEITTSDLRLHHVSSDINHLQELLAWNGVYSFQYFGSIVIPALQKNEAFIRALSLQPFSMDLINQLTFEAADFISGNSAFVKVMLINETERFVEMADITTDKSYFTVAGVTVHNSEGYDVPYLVNRIKRDPTLGNEAVKKLCLWGQTPREKEYAKFGKIYKTYDFVGRVHLDYLLLYQKHNTQQQHSYSLDNISDTEIGERKVPYEGTLDTLYKNDFDKFIEYNRQDVMLMVKIDAKKKFIELANQIAHANCVLLKTTMGSVSLVETAIINEMHSMGYISPNRPVREEVIEDRSDHIDDDDPEERKPVAGAYVAKPKVGLHDHVGCVDLNSLYPSTIRALNMSPETIVGQIRQDFTSQLVNDRIASGTPRAEAWEGLFSVVEVSHILGETDHILTVDFENGNPPRTMSAADWYKWIFNPDNKVCLSANGTLFRTTQDGMIPRLLEKWYSERKGMQKNAKLFETILEGIPIDDNVGKIFSGTILEEFNRLYQKDNPSSVEGFLKSNGMIIHDGVITPSDETARKGIKELYVFWDQRQSAKKVVLNATYGALLQENCRFFDQRIGQSTTLSGRSIVKHMGASINEIITGVYDNVGDAIKYGDTDSVAGSSIIRTNHGSKTIQELFEACPDGLIKGDKEYALDPNLLVMGYDPATRTARLEHINYIYRHKVKKKAFRITTTNDLSVTVTEDHSIMVERDGLVEVKPADLKSDDVIPTIIDGAHVRMVAVGAVEALDDFVDEYVYDIGVSSDNPYFFADDVLVHNSVYFSAYDVLKDHPDYADFEWSKENIIQLYDAIAEAVNDTFPEFMKKTFNTSLKRGAIIKAGRELVASKGLFIKKKKYAVLMYDKENIRLDVDGKPGKLKAMGLDLKRADTPKVMQKFLNKILMDILTGVELDRMLNSIKDFRDEFKLLDPWKKGSPKKVSGLTAYSDKLNSAKDIGLMGRVRPGQKMKVNMPGHVRASLNWNMLCDLNNDKYSQRITDGTRICVCKLKPNALQLDSVAYPIDEPHLPQWFKELPFNDHGMEETIIDKKIMNLVSVLNWNLNATFSRPGDEFFSFV